jgi:hypothetical protein
MKYLLLLLFAGIIFYSCKSDNTIINNSTEPSQYYKIANAESGNIKFEIWSATGQNLFFGYNDIGFKVYINGAEKTDGFVKYKPLMIHFPGQTGHSSPTSASFFYNSTNKLFTGYVCFSMISDSSGQWTGYYNYNNESYVDSIPFSVLYSSAQLTGWDDIPGGNSYILTLLNPKEPSLGLNDFECILHKDIGDNNYAEVDMAEMITKPWMITHGHGSSNNVNPVSQGNGRYKGKVNFTMPGNWIVYDTIKINNTLITKSTPPKFNFDVQ